MMKMIRVSVDSLKPKIRVRRELGDLDKLAESIKEYGVLEPLVVSESDDGGYEVVLGLRRYLAALRAGVDVVPAISIGKIGLLEALEIIFKEDGLRKKLTLDERAIIVAALVEECGVREVARRLGMPVSTIESLNKAGRTFAGVLEVVRSSYTSDTLDINFKVKVKLGERVYEAVSKAGYKGRSLKEIAGRVYLTLVDLPTEAASNILREWVRNPTLEYLEKLVKEFHEAGHVCKQRFKIPKIDERVPIELGDGEPLEKRLLNVSQHHWTSYNVIEEVQMKIVELGGSSDISGLLCPRCNRPLRCRVCGSLVHCLCGYPYLSVRHRKYRYAVKGENA